MMGPFLRMSLVAVASIALPVAIWGEIDIGKYRESIRTHDGKELMDVYVAGVGEGLGWANASLINRGDRPLYCAPQTLSPNGEFYVSILLSQIKLISTRYSQAELLKLPIEPEVLVGLQNTFPCPQKK
jgi:hypothetical protein